MTSEAVTGRSIPRYRGEPVTHDVRFYGDACDCEWPRGLYAECKPCGWHTVLEPGHTAADLTRLARHHAGTEDP